MFTRNRASGYKRNAHVNAVVCVLCSQLQRDLASLRSSPLGRSGGYSVQAILDKWQLFCEKPPKGFEKYFKQGKDSKATAATDAASAETAAKSAENASSASSSGSSSSTKVPPISKPPGDAAKAKQNEWNFGMFSPTAKGAGGGSGRPLGGGDGNNERDKWLLLGAIGVAGMIGLYALMEVSYKEIGWKEFVNRWVIVMKYLCELCCVTVSGVL